MRVEEQLRRFLHRRVLRVDRAPACVNPVCDDVSFRVFQPCVCPLYTPSRSPVTEMGAHCYPDHKGVWIGQGKASGITPSPSSRCDQMFQVPGAAPKLDVMSSIEPGPDSFDLGEEKHGFFALRVVDAAFDKVARAPFELSAAG